MMWAIAVLLLALVFEGLFLCIGLDATHKRLLTIIEQLRRRNV